VIDHVAPFPDTRVAGVALILGYGLLLGVLFRTPSAGLSAAAASLSSLFLFLVLPVIGVLSGIYAYVGGRLHSVLVLVTATYLATVGVTLSLLTPSLSVAVDITGIVLFGLAVVALTGSLRATARSFDVEVL
jgi:hypothetical protein